MHQVVRHLLSHLKCNIFLRLRRRCTEVWCGDKVRRTEERIILGRLFGEHVERGGGEMAAVQRCTHRGFIHQTAAGAVDQAGARFHLGDLLSRQDVRRFLSFWQMQRHEVGASQKVIQLFNLLDTKFLRFVSGKERIKRRDLHFQTQRAGGDNRADIASADQAQRLAGDLSAHELGLFPFASLRRGVGGRDLACGCEHHRNCMFRRGDGVPKRRVHHHGPFGGGCGDINIINANTGAANDFQVSRGLNNLSRRLGRGPDRQPIIIANDRLQFRSVFAKVRLEIHLNPTILEDLHRGFAQLVGNQYFCHSSCP